MLVYCWSTVVDGEPALNLHWFNTSCPERDMVDCGALVSVVLPKCGWRRVLCRRPGSSRSSYYPIQIVVGNSQFSGAVFQPTGTACWALTIEFPFTGRGAKITIYQETYIFACASLVSYSKNTMCPCNQTWIHITWNKFKNILWIFWSHGAKIDTTTAAWTWWR